MENALTLVLYFMAGYIGVYLLLLLLIFLGSAVAAYKATH
jgi:hypothetical protein